MKKYAYCLAVLAVSAALIGCVYLIGGTAGAYAWTFALFVAGPAGALLVIIQTVRLVVNLFKRKNVSVVTADIAASVLLAFPVLILTGTVFIAYPANAGAGEAITINMPIEGDVVLFGGSDYKTHAIWPSERYAYDILAAPYDTGNTDPESYGIYGRQVLAPVCGMVVKAHDGEEDIEPNSERFTSLMGNYIVVKTEETGAYLILAHLRQGSIRVKEGDTVETGAAIALVGNSGTTSEPHLHIQYQRDDPGGVIFPTCSEGLPIVFKQKG